MLYIFYCILSGLRGAIAFALSLNMEFEEEKRHVIVTATLIIVLFTVLFLGGSTMPLMKVGILQTAEFQRFHVFTVYQYS